MNALNGKRPWHLWVVGIAAVMFNAIGVFDFAMYRAQGTDYLTSAGMTPEQIAHYEAMPPVMTIVWGIGVVTAFLASVLLLMRRRPAFVLFVVSLVTFMVSLVYTYGLTDGGAVMGRQMAVTSAVIAVLLAMFAGYAWRMGRRA
ncbi:hypothetical protein BH09PSE6_BH09PSE6_04610 [soil metagenome]